jgi:hypothetical protein
MFLTSEILTSYDACERRALWASQYERFRTPPLAALYRALDAGLTGEKPEMAGHALMHIAATESLDVRTYAVYDAAVHYAHLATLLATYLRAKGPPWTHVEDATLGRHQWRSACYETGGKEMRRLALIDHWSDDRRDQEMRGWRTYGEMAVLNRPVLLNAIAIGSVHQGRRVSAWTQAWTHPKNRHIRFKRKASSESFSGAWLKQWREHADLTAEQWLDQMARDGIFADLVHTTLVPVPPRIEETVGDMKRIARELESMQAVPPMRRTGCYGFSPCPFLAVCYGAQEAVPSVHHFRRKRRDVMQAEPPEGFFDPGPESGPKPSNLVQISKNGLVQA